MNGFWIGLLIGIIIKTIHSKVLTDKERIEWVQQSISILITRLDRLMYLFSHMSEMDVSSFQEQVIEAVGEFSESVLALSNSMKEML